MKLLFIIILNWIYHLMMRTSSGTNFECNEIIALWSVPNFTTSSWQIWENFKTHDKFNLLHTVTFLESKFWGVICLDFSYWIIAGTVVGRSTVSATLCHSGNNGNRFIQTLFIAQSIYVILWDCNLHIFWGIMRKKH